MGQKKITPISPPPGAKMKTKYLYLQKRQTNLSIFAAFCALTETFQYTHFSSCHAPCVAKGCIKGKALRLLRTNSSKTLFEESINNFKSRLRYRGYPNNIVEKTLAEVKFTERKYALQEKQATKNHIAFRLTIQPISAKSQRGFNEQMAYHWETTPALRDFSGTTNFLLQKIR